MMVRHLQPEDIPTLQAMAEASDFPYPDVSDPLVEAVMVAVDDAGRVTAAVIASRTVELYFLCGEKPGPFESLALLREYHETMAEVLKQKGYNCVEAYLPPTIAKRFGRRLEKTFGWVKNWESWGRRF